MKTKQVAAALTVAALLSILFGVASCSKPGPEQKQSGGQTQQYTCAMHPEVVQDKPGKCPKCGMDLVEKH